MKLKRILSTALTVVMIFTTLVAVLPVTASAAHSQSSASSTAKIPEGVTEANLTATELSEYLDEYLKYSFDTAGEMLDHELKAGYLYYSNSQGNYYTLYVNKYTGFVYYVNNVTGQILTSNPYDTGKLKSPGADTLARLMSQISVSFYESVDTSKSYEWNSFEWAASRSQILVSPISGGFRVNYTIGDTTVRFLLPGQVKAADFEEHILVPMIKSYEALLEELCGEKYPDENFSFFENEDYIPYEYECINIADRSAKGLKLYLNNTQSLYQKAYSSTSAEYKQLAALRLDIRKIIDAYTLNAPAKYIGSDRHQATLEQMYKDYPVTKDGTAIYVYTDSSLDGTKRSLANIIKANCPEYTFSMMYAQEAECGYVDKSQQKPVIRCALEYTFNDDGTLSARLPANSITFDESVYTLKSITPLQYFGYGNMSSDGYVFYPDGSGSVIEFDDFYNEENNKKIALFLTSTVYGKDYCYSKISGAHRENITMPVFGIVNEVKATAVTEALHGKETVNNGFFAIIEEGSSLANLEFISGGSAHNYIGTYATYSPYSYDEFDLSDTISVGSNANYTMVSESKYTGSYVTRYVMLTDEEIGEKAYGKNAFYESSYVGMAAYYRNYLKDAGVLETVENVSEGLPLYVEVLGSMDITAKFLTFPITKSIPLTSFKDVEKMYEELSKCEEYVVTKYEEFKALAENEKDEAQKYQYEQQAKRYNELVGKVKNIKSVNFKLTGFANGGMSATYPVKVKWQKACGGKSGFKSLVKAANSASALEGYNFSVYPEFDFMYINNTAMFDGISNKGNVSRMIDNRYASKQVYNAISREYESFFTLVINPDALNKLYSKFIKKYSKYDVNGISVSTLGSDLNSNFDEKNPVNREQAVDAVKTVLDRMVNENGYDVMLDKGNIYALEYASHILNAAIDSSHFRYSSYAVPFVGLVLHSYVNYTGSPLNYSGSPDYDILRSIESGASLYYIVCYQNTSHLKDDEDLNKYYGVDYKNWYDDMLETYSKLNAAIGDLQTYEIVDHETLIAEREIDSGEMAENYVLLQEEILELLDKQILTAVDKALLTLKGDSANYDKRIKVDITEENRASLIALFVDLLNLSASELEANGFVKSVDEIIGKYEKEYAGAQNAANNVTVNFTADEFKYETKYTYITDSCAKDKDYVYTDYTVDNGNVTIVTYQHGEDVVRFILNYNNFPVTVRLSATEVYQLEKHDYVRID